MYMEEKKQATDTTEQNPQVSLVDKEPIAVAMEGTPEPVAAAAAPVKKRSHTLTILAILLVGVALLAVLFRLESEGRVDTGLFSGLIAWQESQQPVALVNGVEIDRDDLAISISQLTDAAVAQGFDPTTAEVQTDIEEQAVTMLVNTELLTQEAVARGITISDEAVAERISLIETDAGGAQALDDRLAEFDLTRTMLQEDVAIELTIQSLLDQVFSDADLVVSEEEIVQVYTNAGGLENPDLPALDDVRPQIEAQLRQVKEQEAVNEYLAELRAGADIEITTGQ